MLVRPIAVLSCTFVAAVVAACSSSSSTDQDETPTFSETVQPIVQDRCQNCHREGGIAPFALETYEQVKAVASLAKDKIVAHEMPPWGAFDSDACKMQHPIKDDLRMKDDEIKKFVRWVETGAQRGDPSKAPPARTFAAHGLIDKTHTFSLPQPYTVEGGAKDDIRCFPIDPGFTEDTWVGGSNVVPGDPTVVHHVIVYTDPNAEGVAKAKATGTESYPCFGGPQVGSPSLLLAWAPGVQPANYGEDAGIKVTKGSHLIVQVHYHPTATTKQDQTGFELKVLPTKPSFVTQILLLGNAESATGILHLLPGPDDPASGPEFKIPANIKGHTEAMEVTIPESLNGGTIPPLSILAAGSHMHWAGVDMKIEVDRKAASDGQPQKECLVGTPKYDFNWQRAYAYDEPFDKLPVVQPGDTLRFTCTYDNTMGNKYVQRALAEQRVAAPVDIHLGETTLDEMCLGAVIAVRRATAID